MKNIELYIHIPFCEKKCNYCDFLSFHSSYEIIDKYIKQLLKEIESKKYLLNDYEVSSIYIGGGTPSFIDSKYIAYIMESIYNNYKVSDNAEISIEVNPNSASNNKLKSYFDVGINRLSIGLQSANDMELSILGRVHKYNDFLITYNNAVHVGFKNINADLINGIPSQTPESYKKTLKQVLMLNIKHISIYNLIIEKNTPFETMLKNNEIQLPLEQDILKMDEITKELTNYYKRLKNISFLNSYLNIDYSKYIYSSDKSIYYDEIKYINEIDHINDYIITGFRKTSGINIDEFKTIFNRDFETTFNTALKIYQGMGMINKKDNNYFLTDAGLNVSNTILSDLLITEI